MRRIFLNIIWSLFIATSFILNSCNDDSISTNSSFSLSFSTNIISFDTVFTTISTTTARFKVYNPHNEAIKISSINLLGGSSSVFRINISGRTNAEQSFNNIELNANDSLYVFVNLRMNPTNQDNPVLIQDKIQFVTNGNTQEVTLQAIGQDVIILRDKTIANDTILENNKPYLIYGNLTIDSGKTLEIEKGSTLYFHDKAGLIVKGNLKALGTINDPIIFRGDRIDNLLDGLPYDSLDGQWNGINLIGENSVSELQYTDIRSAKYGIIASHNNTTSELIISNSNLQNFSKNGILATNIKLNISNTIIGNCGESCITIEGGESNLIHCTIANYFPFTERKSNSLVIKNYDSNNADCPITSLNINNSIIFGTYGNEILFLNNNSATYNVNINSCVLSGNTVSDTKFTNCSWFSKSETIFINTNTYPYNFQLTSNSAARNKGNLGIANNLPTDKNGNSRIVDGKPDTGAFEYFEQ